MYLKSVVSSKTKGILIPVFITIAIYRIVTYVIIYFYGSTSWWHGVYTDSWNHYQLGVVLLVGALIINRLPRVNKYTLTIASVGTGMIIDEVTDVIKLFHLVALPTNFRDSPADLLLILGTYIFFAGCIILSE